jgi:hypothetical protein
MANLHHYSPQHRNPPPRAAARRRFGCKTNVRTLMSKNMHSNCLSICVLCVLLSFRLALLRLQCDSAAEGSSQPALSAGASQQRRQQQQQAEERRSKSNGSVRLDRTTWGGREGLGGWLDHWASAQWGQAGRQAPLRPKQARLCVCKGGPCKQDGFQYIIAPLASLPVWCAGSAVVSCCPWPLRSLPSVALCRSVCVGFLHAAAATDQSDGRARGAELRRCRNVRHRTPRRG